MINRLLPDIHRGEDDVNFYITDGVHPRDSVSNFCLGEEEMTISITGSSNTCEILF